MKDLEMEKLAEKLKSLKKPLIEDSKKEALKNNLMARIKSEDVGAYPFSISALPELLKQSAKGISLDLSSRVRIKERVFEMIENHSQKSFFFSNFFAFNRKLLSSVLVFVIFFGAFNFVNVNTRVVRAATFTVLKSYSGEVFVDRDGKSLEVIPGMKLYENDEVSTGMDGRAVIEYFDNSVSRMASGTRLVLKKLQKPSENSAESNVEVSVIQGVLWSKVLNLVGSDSLFVVDANKVSASARKAAFNVKVDNDELEIGVFHHAVDVSDKNGVSHLLTGNKLLLTGGDYGSKKLITFSGEEQDDGWVKENLEFDKKYLSEVENRLLIAKAESAGVNIDDDLSFDKSLRENAILFLTFDDVKSEKIELDLVEKNFIAAQLKLHDSKLTDEERAKAELAIKDFSEKVEGFYSLADKIGDTDVEYANELRSYLNDKINSHKKDLSLVMPGAPEYLALEAVNKLQLLQAKNQTDVAEIKLQQAGDKLSSVEDVADSGDLVLAEEVADSYKDDVEGALKLIQNIEPKDSKTKEKKEKLAEKASRDIALLETIQPVPEDVTKPVVSVMPKEVDADSSVATSVSAVPATSAVPELVEEPEIIQQESIIEGPYGVTIKGDKVLSPFLEDIN